MYKIREYGNSVRLVYRKMKGVSSVALGFWVNAGSRNEPAATNGVSHFLEHLLFKGSKKYSGDQIKENIEGLGGSLNAFTSEENTCYYAKFLGRHLKKVFGVLSDMVLHPVLKESDIEKERTVIIEEIKMYKDLPQFQVAEVFDELLWPHHPLGRNIAGSIETVKAISRGVLSGYHSQWYSPANIVIACAGDLDEELLEDSVETEYSSRASRTAAVGRIETFCSRIIRGRRSSWSPRISSRRISISAFRLSGAHTVTVLSRGLST